MLKFTGKIWNMGESSVVTIPKTYVKNDMLVLGKEYVFMIKEQEVDDNGSDK